MRDEIERGPAAPSGVSRLMVLAATFGAVIIAAWLLVPALLNNYIARSALVTPAKSRAAVQERAIPAAPSVVLAATPASAAPAPTAPDETASLQRDDAAPVGPDTTVVLAAHDAQPALGGPTEVTTAMSLPAEPAPPPVRPLAPALQFAAAAPAPAETTGNLPLPRSRPTRAIAARLAIPLPRPRPEIASDGPNAEEQAFERAVERMR